MRQRKAEKPPKTAENDFYIQDKRAETREKVKKRTGRGDF
jgi:hypothetical protein